MNPSFTIKDVARLAGVSTATVTRVLHGSGYVSEATRKRVEEVLAQTGYQVNAMAQGLKSQRHRLIGHLVNSLIPNPYCASVAYGVEREARRRGYDVLIFDMNDDEERERTGVEALLRRRPDAIIFTAPIRAENVALAAASGTPVVQVERITETPSHGVAVDNRRGSFEATLHLIELGHRHIAFLGGQQLVHAKRSVEHERLAGFRDAMERHGLPVDERLVVLARYFVFDANDENGFGAGLGSVGYRRTQALLRTDPRPTAIFAASDLFATGALQAIHEAGLRVPADISVVGYDNTLAPFLSPPLTTVALPLLDMGLVAAELALAAAEERATGATPAPPRVEHLTTRLLLRQSTAPAPGK
ncbi:LacI family DNA-binding transcriptional regulator [Deinococcus planocerae]|uniref:LacI family DNA-binding transcriptional regulator n=1 Tax=Deinococcus planocerae TaxID=1737569 RepID=UPI000C7EA3CC|nr:LacI family DNA-binding transcriptional regulator [Deinococcus planocerae]